VYYIQTPLSTATYNIAACLYLSFFILFTYCYNDHYRKSNHEKREKKVSTSRTTKPANFKDINMKHGTYFVLF